MANSNEISVHRSYKKENYTTIANYIFQEKGAGNAIALLTFMISKPPEWDFSIRNIAREMGLGTAWVKSGLDKLKELGYVEYHGNARDSKGRICKARYDVWDIPKRIRDAEAGLDETDTCGHANDTDDVDDIGEMGFGTDMGRPLQVTPMQESPCIENQHMDSESDEKPRMENPCMENPCMEKPRMENPTLINKDIIKDIDNNNININNIYTQTGGADAPVGVAHKNIEKPRYFPDHPRLDAVFRDFILKQTKNNNRLTKEQINRNMDKVLKIASRDGDTFDEELAIATVIHATDRGWRAIFPMNSDDYTAFMKRRQQKGQSGNGNGMMTNEYTADELDSLEKSLLAN